MVEMKKKKIVIALGHEALGTTLPEQKESIVYFITPILFAL